ncbi:tetratricopeptide repeat protein [Chitinophaga nivalis]|uniref:Tetratricopeptide repeat protein n=1 Tax=Chitinophaga nivalis TaxID=2991709 RepID=A0ABT3IR72_9BACT|nr:tetratricopeptide repeat protein [Chitinophaga nivalis]MCW3463827.1 tetratricopeptide repeat protein [Chitinophaga nivalis]MCW3486483.1 tetratricopeptide repeat protein [Chitinophaga nivalis]
MKITLGLQLHPHTIHTPKAAFVPGATAAGWLQEISSWGMDMLALRAIAVPADISSITPAGLLVLFQDTPVPDSSRIRYPYGLLGNKLFVPVNATLTPAVSDAELPGILIWDLQLLHPTTGFIGFAETDLFPLQDLLQYTTAGSANWDYARNGITPPAKLTYIRIQPATTGLFDDIHETINSRPLEEMMVHQNTSSRLKDKLLYIFTNSLLWLFRGLKRLLPGTPDLSRYKWMKWVKATQASIEEKRQHELEKLMRLFDTDMNTALQYAIPLDQPYASRGTAATPGTQLVKRDTAFSLGKLKSNSGPADEWNTDTYYAALRNKYQLAAAHAIAQKDYKKAAYVYAALLGDYSNAANVLEQGGYFREAAALYESHLNKPATAAACLERGGLLLEAIGLYASLEQYEKAGDLYVTLQQPEKAGDLYQVSLQKAIAANEPLEAARISRHKLQQPEQAAGLLLDGWQHHTQHERCLQQYFEVATPLPQAIQQVYTTHTPAHRFKSFIQVLQQVTTTHNDPVVKNIAVDIAYEIVSKQSLENNGENLFALSNFFPADPLLTSDLTRYLHTMPPPVSPPINTFRFAADVTWLTGTSWKGQALLIGVKANGIYLLRFDLVKNWAYVLWPGNYTPDLQFTLVHNARFSEAIMVHGSQPLRMETKRLENKDTPDSFFRDVVITCPDWLPTGLLGYCLTEKDVITIHHASGVLVLSHYSYTGQLAYAVDCKVDGATVQVDLAINIPVQGIIYRGQHLFFSAGSSLIKCDLSGNMQLFDMGHHIYRMYANPDEKELKISISSSGGAFVLSNTESETTWKRIFLTRSGTRATWVKHLPEGIVLVGEDNKVKIYRSNDDTTPGHYNQLETGTKICAVLPAAQPGHMIVFEVNGQAGIHPL